jgi:hypothetical protein
VGHFEREIHGLLLAQAGNDIVISLGLEAWRFHLDGIRARLQLGKIESARIIGLGASPESGFGVDGSRCGAGHDGVARVPNLANDGARGFALPQRLRRKQTNDCPQKKSDVGCPCHESPVQQKAARFSRLGY